MYMYVCICMYVYVYIYIYIYACMYVIIFRAAGPREVRVDQELHGWLTTQDSRGCLEMVAKFV